MVPSTSFTVGRATIDLAGHRLLRDGEVRPIKPKAFDLLAFLLRHQGQVFSARAAAGRRLGLRLRGRDADGRRSRPLAARRDRARPAEPKGARNRPRRGLRAAPARPRLGPCRRILGAGSHRGDRWTWCLAFGSAAARSSRPVRTRCLPISWRPTARNALRAAARAAASARCDRGTARRATRAG